MLPSVGAGSAQIKAGRDGRLWRDAGLVRDGERSFVQISLLVGSGPVCDGAESLVFGSVRGVDLADPVHVDPVVPCLPVEAEPTDLPKLDFDLIASSAQIP